MRPFWGIAVAALLLGVLTGCEESNGATPTPSPSATESASPSPSESPSPTTSPPPSVPVAARPSTQAGAVSFGLYFIDLMNHTVNTGKTARFEAEYSRACEACRAVTKEIRAIYGDGGFVRGGDFKVDTYSSLRANARTWTMGADVVAGRQSIVRSGEPREERTGGKYSITLDIRRENPDWRITWMQVEER